MRLHFLLLGLFVGLEVLALDSAAPYEMMYFYAAYKAEWLSGMPVLQRQIAIGCKRGKYSPGDFDAQAAAAGVKGMCSFDDFVKFVGTERTFADYHYSEVGNMWNMEQYWSQIKDKFAQYKLPGASADDRYRDDLQKLLPKANFGAAIEPFEPAVKGVANALQAARIVTPNLAAVEDQAKYAKEFARIALQFRNMSGLQAPKDTINAYFAKLAKTKQPNPFVLQLKPGGTPIPSPSWSNTGNILSYSGELDFDATVKNNPDGVKGISRGRQWGELRNDFAKSYTNTQVTKNHNSVIQAFKTAVDVIAKNEPSCPNKRDLLSLKTNSWPRNAETESEMIDFQSHLISIDIKFKKMEGFMPEQLFGHITGIGAGSA